jgi:t-SNARE complex subunit (syntaxin)
MSGKDIDSEFAEDRSYDSVIFNEDIRLKKLLLKNKVEFNQAIIDERNEEIEKIFQDIKDINEIFKDLHKLTQEQTNPISVLEENINLTVENTEKAIVQLKKAESYQNSWFSSKNKMILMGIAGLSINTPIALLFGVKVGVISGVSTIGLSALSTLFGK